jgi:hypothetical protein
LILNIRFSIVTPNRPVNTSQANLILCHRQTWSYQTWSYVTCKLDLTSLANMILRHRQTWSYVTGKLDLISQANLILHHRQTWSYITGKRHAVLSRAVSS